MLTIRVNGREEKLNIGCRTVVSLDILLKNLEADVQQVTLNGTIISSQECGNITVKGGDSLLLNG